MNTIDKLRYNYKTNKQKNLFLCKIILTKLIKYNIRHFQLFFSANKALCFVLSTYSSNILKASKIS